VPEHLHCSWKREPLSLVQHGKFPWRLGFSMLLSWRVRNTSTPESTPKRTPQTYRQWVAYQDGFPVPTAGKRCIFQDDNPEAKMFRFYRPLRSQHKLNQETEKIAEIAYPTGPFPSKTNYNRLFFVPRQYRPFPFNVSQRRFSLIRRVCNKFPLQ